MKADVFSYGVVLLEVACGEIPVVEKRHLMLQNCKSKWEEIYTVIVQCTNQNPEDRPTMRDILRSVEKIKP